MKTRIQWLLRRLSLMSPGEIVYRTAQAVRHRADSAMVRYRRARPSPPGEPATITWLTDLAESEKLACFARERFAWTEEHAEELLDHRFSFFSFERMPFGPTIAWNRDYSSGKEAPLVYGPTLNYRDEHLVGDIKYAWEHNRHHHLVELAKAYYLTGVPKYADEVRDEIGHWIESCPYPMGINWASSLESAIRVINWSFCLQFLRAGGSWLGQQGVFIKRLTSAVHDHLAFISGHFSRYSSANNHLIGEASGLFVGALCFRFPESEEWIQKAAAVLRREAVRQHWPDGSHKEQAVAYQVFVFDFLLIPALLGERNGFRFPEVYWQVLERSAEFICALMDEHGAVPQFGDDDDGTVVLLSRAKDFSRYRSLLATAAALFDRADFRERAQTLDEKTFWLLGREGAERFAHASQRPGVRRQFYNGGYYILRQDDMRLVMDCGPLGYLSLAAHGHADALSIVLDYKGVPFFVDPGTYAYHTKKEWRNYFRSTAAHNTVRIDGEDQSQIGGNFMWISKAECTLLSADGWHVRGSHDGYARLPDPVLHEREVRFVPAETALVIRDKLICRRRHRIEQFFHLHPSCTCAPTEDGFVINSGEAGIRLLVSEGWRKEVLQGSTDPIGGWYSPGFDRKVSSSTIRLTRDINGATEWVTRVILH